MSSPNCIVTKTTDYKASIIQYARLSVVRDKYRVAALPRSVPTGSRQRPTSKQTYLTLATHTYIQTVCTRIQSVAKVLVTNLCYMHFAPSRILFTPPDM